MAYAFQEKQDDVLGSQKDEEQQNNTMLTSTAGDLGAETFNAGASGQSVGQKDQARQPQQTKRELLSRNQGRAQNPFQFQQTRQALGQAKQGVQTERDTYMQNAVTPYQYGQEQQQAVKTYAREGGPAGQTPDWLAKYQQGVPTALPTFQSNVQTNFAPVNALKTDAGVRSFLRNPNDPESRSGEQAIDFSLLNADPTFNINREGVLRDYSDLLKLQDETVQNTPIEARKAQLAAAEAFKKGITGTLEGEMAGIQGEASAAEQAYDAQLAAMNSAENRNRILQDVTGQIAKEAPENLRGLIRNPMGTDYSKLFNPITGEATKAEDFLTEDQAGDFNRIASIIGRGGSVAARGRLAGQKVGDDALRFDRNAYRDMILNQAQRDYESMQQSPFAGTGAYDADMGSLPPLTPAAQPAPPPAASGAPLGSYERVLEQARRAPGVLRDSLFTGLPKINDVPGVSFLSDGGRVPGKAPMPGDHQANDVVNAKLSPGEIVIPRSMASDKESAKEFIDNMPFANTKALLKPKYNCGGKVGSYACGGKVPGYAEGGRVNAIEYTGGFDTPIPGVDEAKRKFDDYLTEKIVNPMAQAGYEDLGAALATIPSTAVEAFVPSSAGDIMMGAAPFPKTLRSLKRFDEKGRPFENVGVSEFTPKEAPKVPDEMMQKVAGKSYNEAEMVQDPLKDLKQEILTDIRIRAQENGLKLTPSQEKAILNEIDTYGFKEKHNRMNDFYAKALDPKGWKQQAEYGHHDLAQTGRYKSVRDANSPEFDSYLADLADLKSAHSNERHLQNRYNRDLWDEGFFVQSDPIYKNSNIDEYEPTRIEVLAADRIQKFIPEIMEALKKKSEPSEADFLKKNYYRKK